MEPQPETLYDVGNQTNTIRRFRLWFLNIRLPHLVASLNISLRSNEVK